MAEHAEPQVKRQKTEMDPIFREFHDDEALLNDLKHAVIILRNGYNHMNLALQSILETNVCSAVSFSKATVTIKTIEDAGRRGSFVAGSIFCDGIYVLEQYIDAKKVPKEYRRNVLAKLLKFLSKEGRLWLRGAGQLGPKPQNQLSPRCKLVPCQLCQLVPHFRGIII